MAENSDGPATSPAAKEDSDGARGDKKRARYGPQGGGSGGGSGSGGGGSGGGCGGGVEGEGW